MDTLSVALAAVPFDRSDVKKGDEVAIVCVNGRDFLDVVNEFERPLALRAGFSGTSSYDAPPASRVLLPAVHWLGSPGGDLSRGGWAVVYTCRCGDWGCGGLLARIDVGEEVVIWSDFQTPFSIDFMIERPNEPVQGDISREGLGPFRFDRTQYEAALRSPKRIDWPYGSPNEELPHVEEA